MKTDGPPADLSEVKAILRKLQQIDLIPPNQDETASEPAMRVRATDTPQKNPGIISGPAIAKAQETSTKGAVGSVSQPGRRFPLIAFALVAGIAITAAVIWKQAAILGDASRPIEATDVSPPSPAELLQEARIALAKGDVVQARNILLRNELQTIPDAALLLAQSYNPSYLKALPQSNAAADSAEARKWYQKWYELAVQSGLEMDSQRFQRIMKSLR
jgi:hypothetical protein